MMDMMQLYYAAVAIQVMTYKVDFKRYVLHGGEEKERINRCGLYDFVK